MTLNQLVQKIKEIKNMGFVSTTRAHQGGVGNTLEHYLGIKENNLRTPDLGKIEIKAKRLSSSSMLTLSSRAPQKKGANRRLFEVYKYFDDKEGIYKFYNTVYGSKFNSKGFKVTLNSNNLVLENPKNLEAYWPIVSLDDVLKKNSNLVVLVFAETKGDVGSANEGFHYVEAYLLEGLDLMVLKKAIQNDKLKIDIRIGADRTGENAGKYHDHGTGFRISKGDYLQLFTKVTKLI